MPLLADENVEASIVARLRYAGHDVLAVAESAKSISDPEVLRLSVRQLRVVVTND